MGKTAGHGMVWLLLSNGLTKGQVIIAQLVLGLILTTHDFGIYFIVMSIAMYIQTFRDGGVRDYLTQRINTYFKDLGPCFWLSVVVNCVVGLILGLAGELVGYVYAQTKNSGVAAASEISTLVWIMAASLPLGSAAPVLIPRLRMTMQFKSLATWTVLSGAIRYIGQIGLALAGFGTYSLIIPFIAVAIFDSAYLIYATRVWPWMYLPGFKQWGFILKRSGWLILGQSFAGILNSGYFLLAGLFVPVEVIGVLGFAVQLHMQIETLIGQAVVGVMQPVLTRLRDDLPRQGQACLRIARAATLISAPATLGVALLYPVAESIVFAGKWADAAIPLAVLAIGYVARSSFVSIPNPLLLARDAFKEWALIWGINCLGVLVFATLGALAASRVSSGMVEGSSLGLDQWRILILSLAVSVFLVVGCWFTTAQVMRTIGVRYEDTLRACIGILPLVAAITAVCALFDYFVLVPRLEAWFPHDVVVAKRSFATSDLIRAPILGLTFAISIAAGLRVLAGAQVADALGVLPGRLSKPLKRVMML